MELYVFRHGPAVETGENGAGSDAERMLSEEGRKKTERAALGLRALGCRPEAILSSPLVRAAETAEILAQTLDCGGPVRVVEELAPGAATDGLFALLSGLDAASAMLVGHMPDLAELVSDLVCSGGVASILLGKAAVCRVAFEGRIAPGRGTLEWVIQPSILRQVEARNFTRRGGA